MLLYKNFARIIKNNLNLISSLNSKQKKKKKLLEKRGYSQKYLCNRSAKQRVLTRISFSLGAQSLEHNRGHYAFILSAHLAGSPTIKKIENAEINMPRPGSDFEE